MTKPTVDDFKSRFGDRFDLDDETILSGIDLAWSIHSLAHLPALYAAAHFLTLMSQPDSGLDGGAGEVTTDRLGEKELITMAQAEAGREAFFTSTLYGRTFLALEKRTRGRAFRGLVVA